MNFLKTIPYLIGVPIAFVFGVSIPEVRAGHLPKPGVVRDTLTGAAAPSVVDASQVFQVAFHSILDDYDKNLEKKALRQAGMQGVLASLGDPHTIFLLPKIASQFTVETRGNFVGIGARLSPNPRGALIVGVFPDGPAKAAGLHAGDLIIGVDGKSVAGVDVDKIIDRIRGTEGTIVKLQLLREGGKQTIIPLKRRQVQTPTVEGKYLEASGVGYLLVSNFAEPTTDQFDQAWDALDQQAKGKGGLKGLVIDLRSNPGGLLETACEMVGRFVEGKPVVRMKFREHVGQADSPSGYLHPHKYPVAVLMDEDSASAAEIFAGNMRDYGRAFLVGTHSYGKASVQDTFRLYDSAIAKITVAKYFLPGGDDIGRKVDEFGTYISGGLEPTYRVDLDPDGSIIIGDPEKDPQLKKAVSELLAKNR